MVPKEEKDEKAVDIVTLNSFLDDSMTKPIGQRRLSYKIEADTVNTAIANLITTGYDTAGKVSSTQQSRYRMTPDGTLTLLSIDVEFSNQVHLIYTPQ